MYDYSLYSIVLGFMFVAKSFYNYKILEICLVLFDNSDRSGNNMSSPRSYQYNKVYSYISRFHVITSYRIV